MLSPAQADAQGPARQPSPLPAPSPLEEAYEGAYKEESGEGETGIWLERLSTGLNLSGIDLPEAEQYSYRGVFIYQYGDHSESLRITHGRVNGEKYERLEHLDGEPREIIRRGEQLTRIQADNRLTRFYRKRLMLQTELCDLRQNYALRSVGDTRVAGRRAVVLAIEPHDELRYSYRLTLDQDTALILGWELLDNNERMLERFRFTTIDIDDPLPAAWVVEPYAVDMGGPTQQSGEESAGSGDSGLATITPLWRPDWLPPGFGLSLPVRHVDEQVQTYSDGLAVISIFLERTGDVEHDMPDGATRRGATVAYLHRAELNGHDYLVTVLGEVPQATARQVALSVIWLGDEQ